MATYAVFFLLYLLHRAVLERPTNEVGLWRRRLDVFGLGEGTPEVGEVLKLDVMPDLGEVGGNE